MTNNDPQPYLHILPRSRDIPRVELLEAYLEEVYRKRGISDPPDL